MPPKRSRNRGSRNRGRSSRNSVPGNISSSSSQAVTPSIDQTDSVREDIRSRSLGGFENPQVGMETGQEHHILGIATDTTSSLVQEAGKDTPGSPTEDSAVEADTSEEKNALVRSSASEKIGEKLNFFEDYQRNPSDIPLIELVSLANL